jgi:CBS domain-containing protein
VRGILTDGDLRRKLKDEGKGIFNLKMADLTFKAPLSIRPDALLHDAVELFRKHQVDNLVVSQDGQYHGILDIQDLVKLNLLG